jgi:DNA mismatch repair protein MutL
MTTIRILSEKVASQIAAGEVVERPASVVRELVDNSIDAGADRIIVHLEMGGRRLIKVKDNGAGMSRNDLLLSIERHATSKIESVSDLFSVKTLGFRGEALPSIASVSKMEMISKLENEVSGHKLRIAGGKLLSVEETGTPQGTVIEVRDLFFNLPARRKFLRSPQTETGYITDYLARVSIPFPQIGFRLEENGRSILDLPASEKVFVRFSALMGRDVADSMTFVEEVVHSIRIKAFLASSRFSRSRGDRLFVYANGRNIRDRLVTKAVMEGFGQRLMKGQYPQAVIFIDLDPSLLDVNVHPTKQEVRFRNSLELFQGISSTVEKALGGVSHSQVYMPKKPHPWGSEQTCMEGPAASETQGSYVEQPRGKPFAFAKDVPINPSLMDEAGPRIIGQLADTYILCEVEDELLIVDQHAAHERILYEKIKEGLRESNLQSQTLLMPIELDLSVKDGRVLLENLSSFHRLGIDLEHFGGNTFLLRAVPAMMKNARWESFLPELAGEMEKGTIEKEGILENIIRVMACHGAIRAGQDLSREEMTLLLRQLKKMELPTNCPHGRPVFSQIGKKELERMFKRVL